jgi:putative resolvase
MTGDVNFKEWARLQGIHPQTAYRWFREGTLPVPAVRVNARSVLVAPDAVTAPARGGIGLYARVSSHDQRVGLGRRVARLTAWAAQSGCAVVRAGAEVGPGMNGARPKARRLLADPGVRTAVAGHQGRLGRMNTELAGAALSAHGRRLVVLDPDEADDDLVRDVTEVLTSFCARLYGRRPARNRAEKALRCAARDAPLGAAP